MGKSLKTSFCHCIESVRRTVKPRNNSTRTGAAIAICTKSVLHSRGKTFKRFKCSGKRKTLITRKKLN